MFLIIRAFIIGFGRCNGCGRIRTLYPDFFDGKTYWYCWDCHPESDNDEEPDLV